MLKSKGVQEGWTFFKKKISKARQRAVPMCQKDELAGKKSGLANRQIWLELRKKMRIYDLWRKGEAAQDYKDVMRLCKEKIRSVKVQLEHILATTIKDNRNVSINTLSTKEGPRKISFIG